MYLTFEPDNTIFKEQWTTTADRTAPDRSPSRQDQDKCTAVLTPAARLGHWQLGENRHPRD